MIRCVDNNRLKDLIEIKLGLFNLILLSQWLMKVVEVKVVVKVKMKVFGDRRDSFSLFLFFIAFFTFFLGTVWYGMVICNLLLSYFFHIRVMCSLQVREPKKRERESSQT